MPRCATCGFDSDQVFRFCPECGAEATNAASREQRKTVTVVFCDLAGSTALGESLDPERLRVLLARYFARMKAIVESHGGTVEKFIGDAVVAVFGIPVLHEDDALRAVRAAADMRDALPDLGLIGRIGVTTGEVVAGTMERLATGDPMNVAARLEQAAPPGQILIGEPTLALVRDAVDVEAVEPLTLKGKSRPVPAHRLLRVLAVPARSHDGAFVARERELGIVRDMWDRARAERCCELVTIVGDAGVGKSRLVAELAGSTGARIVRGTCGPYCEGITYAPIVDVLKQLGPLSADEPVASVIHSLLYDSADPSTADEIAWAFRKTLEQAATEEPLVVVLDDIQWGEETFLDLVEHVGLLSAGAPILLACIARPELAERRPGWPITLRLEPLRDSDVDRLIPATIDDDLRARIARASGGNPLFVLEMLDMAANSEGEVVVPPTLQALIAARLDQLEPAERGVLERASIEGERFHRGAVQALSPTDTPATPRLAALVRKQLIRPDAASLPGDDGFCFRHLLVRDAAYDGLTKSTRAELHERLARWLEDRGVDHVERDENLGYHFEQACRYRRELGAIDEETAALAQLGHQRLAAAGFRATGRGDYGAGLRLLERAAELVSAAERSGRFEITLAYARFLTDQPHDAVFHGLGEAIDGAVLAGDRTRELALRLERAVYFVVYDGKHGDAGDLRELAAKALPSLEEAGDDWALATCYSALAVAEETEGGSLTSAATALGKALEHARLAQFGMLTEWARATLASVDLEGGKPVGECLRWLDENPGTARTAGMTQRAVLLAMLGRFEESHRLLAEVAIWSTELGAVMTGHSLLYRRYEVAMLEGAYVVAEAVGRELCAIAVANAQEYHTRVALALIEQDRHAEAASWLERGDETPNSEPLGQIARRRALARVRAYEGRHAEALELAQGAVSLCGSAGALRSQGDAYADLAVVLAEAGQAREAVAALTHAVESYELKGNLVSAQRARERLGRLRDTTLS